MREAGDTKHYMPASGLKYRCWGLESVTERKALGQNMKHGENKGNAGSGKRRCKGL